MHTIFQLSAYHFLYKLTNKVFLDLKVPAIEFPSIDTWYNLIYSYE